MNSILLLSQFRLERVARYTSTLLKPCWFRSSWSKSVGLGPVLNPVEWPTTWWSDSPQTICTLSNANNPLLSTI